METEYLPSGKFVKIVLGILVSVALIFAIHKGSPAIQNMISDFMDRSRQQTAQKNQDAYADYRSLDTDKDGLLDWEEALYGTNAEVADTDGDGKSDYEEFGAINSVGVETNTTIPGGVNSVLQDDSVDDAFDPNNLTDSLARDLYTSLSIAKQQAGGTLQTSDTDQLATIAAKSIQSFTPKSYSVSDITVVDTSSQSKTTFINQFKNLQTESPIQPNDLRSILFAINNTASVPVDVTNRIARYPQFLAQHLSLSVPKDIAPAYIAYINALSAYFDMVTALGSNDIDPARAIGAVQSMDVVLDNSQSTLTALIAKLQS